MDRVITQNKMLIVKEGIPIILTLVLSGLLCSFIPLTFFRILGVILFILGVFSCFFFRDPARNVVNDPSFFVAPADGRILEVSEEEHPDMEGKVKVVKIFLSIFNVHIQRSPMDGKISKIEYKKGNFLDARNPRASFENESNTFLIENDHCKVAVKQIAGFIARRIVSWEKIGQSVQMGQKIGLIRFGSQVDIFLPQEVDVCVEKGEKVMAGVSVIALHKKKIQSNISSLQAVKQ
jgi:phosphatidylserine decarboxylase